MALAAAVMVVEAPQAGVLQAEVLAEVAEQAGSPRVVVPHHMAEV